MSSSLSPAPALSPDLHGRDAAAAPGAATAGGHAHNPHSADTRSHHIHAPRRAATAAPRIGTSILRLSLAARLGLAMALMVPLWVAVILVAG